MQIYGPTSIHGPQAINAPHANRPVSPAATRTSTPIQDEVQLSDVAQLVSRAQDLPAIREDRVLAIRQALADGTYLTDDKLDLAMERLLDEIA